MGKIGTLINTPPRQKRDNTFAFTNYEKAMKLNYYFASISTVDGANSEVSKFENLCTVLFTEIIITESEVVDILKILKLNKATGPEDIRYCRKISRETRLYLC